MIECPICHISNEDRSLFCVECGQRFTQVSAPSNNEATSALLKPPTPDVIPRRPSTKLHSPILDGASDRDQISNSGNHLKPNNYNLPGLGDQPKTQGNKAERALGSSLSDDDHAHRRNLRSPLLDGKENLRVPTENAFRQRETENLAQSNTDLRPTRPSKPLRSPLLSGGLEEDSDEITPLGQSDQSVLSTPNTLGRPARLRSPVLDGAFADSDPTQADEYLAVEEIKDPNILRSPLLAAKVSLPEKPNASVVPGDNKTSGLSKGSIINKGSALPKSGLDATNNAPLPMVEPVAHNQHLGFPSVPMVHAPQMDGIKTEALGSKELKPEVSRAETTKAEGEKPVMARVESVNVADGFGEARTIVGNQPPAAHLIRSAANLANNTTRQNSTSAVQSQAELRETERQRMDSASYVSKAAMSSKTNLLKDKEVVTSTSARRLSGPTVGVLLAVLILTKAYYLFSLGSSALSPSSFPFLVDQVTQLIVIISLIICT